MASSSYSHSILTASPSYSHSAPQSYNCQVFLSFRGEDTRKTFVDHLYSALVDRQISTFKDDEIVDRGESIRPSLLKAIEGAQIAVIVFSENYADSSWCLEELAHIMKCKVERELIVMPIFHGVVPSEVRKQEGDFGEGFVKQEVAGNFDKVKTWRKALVDACEIAGWETGSIANGHESKGIKEIADKISHRLFSKTSGVYEDLVGMMPRMEELEENLKIGTNGVHMVGIWGCGGSGKTTLANSIYRKISCHFQGHCIVGSIREKSRTHGLETLQQNILSKLLNTKVEVESVEEGKWMISKRLSRSNFLILLDDVDHIDQLEALAGSHDWFGSGSRIIITTRDEHLLRTHKVDHVSPVRLLSDEEAIKLFNKRAYNKKNPIKGYETLSSSVVSYAAGLPLALKVLGSLLNNKDEKEWRSTLTRLKDIPERDILKQLKISYDGLESVDKDLFLDIACFFRWRSIDKATEIFEACDYYHDIGIKVLEQKALITIVDGKFDMHDLIQEMGHNIVRGEHPNNPTKHSRVWKDDEIVNMCLGNAIMENYDIEAIQYNGDPSLFCKIISNMKRLRWLSLTISNHHNLNNVLENAEVPRLFDLHVNAEAQQHDGDPSIFSKIVSYMKKLRWLCLTTPNHHNVNNVVKNAEVPQYDVVENTGAPGCLSNELCYIHLEYYPKSPFPDNFQPLKLVTLKLTSSMQEELWKGYKHLQYLKVLELSKMKNLVSTPDFDGLPLLQKLTLHLCEALTSIHPSLGKHECLEEVCVSFCFGLEMFPTIVHMGKLNTLKIFQCSLGLKFPEVKSRMESLVKLTLNNMGIDSLLSSLGEQQFANLMSLELTYCYLENKGANYYPLNHLEEFELSNFGNMEMGRDLYKSSCLTWLSLVLSHSTTRLRKLSLSGSRLRDGEVPASIGELSNLRELYLSDNDFSQLDFSLLQLTRLKKLSLHGCKQLLELPELPSSLAILQAGFCESLKTIGDFHKKCKWICQISIVNTSISITDRSRLLDSMLQGKAIENHSMLLELEGLHIAKEFTPSLVRGHTYKLKLQENWCDEFCGFLMCAVVKRWDAIIRQRIDMDHVISGMDSREDVLWEESDDDTYTWVFYVSFATLRHGPWWNSTYKALSISCIHQDPWNPNPICRAFGVRLVPRKSGSGPNEISTTQEEFDQFSHYTPKFEISHNPTTLSLLFPNEVLDLVSR